MMYSDTETQKLIAVPKIHKKPPILESTLKKHSL